jgi:predicted DCC family thiol-disulfide oxidoreductase YuxK
MTDYPPLIGPDDQVILFDGVCRLCNAWSRFVMRRDARHRFKLCSMQSDEGQAILRWFRIPSDDPASMLLVQGNRVSGKSEAYLRIVRQLPFPWRLLAVSRIVPRGLRDRIYDQIAANRYNLFGKVSVCPIAPDHNNRFLHQ